MPRFCANLTMLYNDVDFLDRFEAAARDGFEGVEYLFPYAYPKEVLAERINGIKKALESSGQGPMARSWASETGGLLQ